jgi:hypothetical protein
MALDEQTELFAQRIKGLGRFQFLFRPAIAEGHIGQGVLPLSIRDEDRDKETGEYQFPDQPLVQRVRAALAKHSGIPVKRLIQEQDQRILPAVAVREVGRSIPQTGGALSNTLRQPTRDGQPVQQQPNPLRRSIQRRVRES